jgi:hypothetical protein
MNGYIELLREEVVHAAVREHRARRRRRAVAKVGAGLVVIAGIVVVLVGILIAPGQEPASADDSVRVTREPQATLVEILAPDRPEDVVRDLRAAGLTADRVDRATGPSRVGMVISVVIDPGMTPTENTNGLISAYVSGDARLEIGVGVATPKGEAYDVGTDALAPGEPLDCRSWPGQSADQLAETARSLGVSVSFIDEAIGPVQEPPPRRIVRSATAIAADRVVVMIGTGPVTPMPVACSSPPSTG